MPKTEKIKKANLFTSKHWKDIVLGNYEAWFTFSFYNSRQFQFIVVLYFYSEAYIQFNIFLIYQRTYKILCQRKYLFELNLVFDF